MYNILMMNIELGVFNSCSLYFFPSSPTETNKLRYKIQIIGQNDYVEAFLFEKVYEKFSFSCKIKKLYMYACNVYMHENVNGICKTGILMKK